MKYIVMIILLFMQLTADDKQQKITIGLGPYMQTQPYENLKDIFVPSPVFFFDNSLFYARWTRFGMYFLGNKAEEFSWGFSLTVQPRTFGYKAKDSKSLIGMDDRKTSLEGGIAFSAAYDDANIETLLLTDVIDRYATWVLSTNIGYKYVIAKTSFYPSVGVTYQSSNFMNYYYGVKKNEVSVNRPLYTPSAGLQFTVQTYVNYELTNSLDILLNARADFIPPSAQNSPLVNENIIYSGLVSLLYTFKY